MRITKGKITEISAGKNPRVQRSHIYLDGKFAFSLDNEVVLHKNLRVGRDLTWVEVLNLTQADHYQKCLNAAYRFLAYRPRSETEIRQRLQRRKFTDEDIERTISELKNQKLIDDAAFAEFWRNSRTEFRPRSRRMVKQELRLKGVETDVIDDVVEEIDDRENAYKAAMAKARSLPLTDYEIFRQRLGAYLQRRGFSYRVINQVLKQAWEESLTRLPLNQEVSGLRETP